MTQNDRLIRLLALSHVYGREIFQRPQNGNTGLAMARTFERGPGGMDQNGKLFMTVCTHKLAHKTGQGLVSGHYNTMGNFLSKRMTNIGWPKWSPRRYAMVQQQYERE